LSFSSRRVADVREDISGGRAFDGGIMLCPLPHLPAHTLPRGTTQRTR
jgi:hypothetical protein